MNLSLGIVVRHHSASLMMPNRNPGDEICYLHTTSIKDYFISPQILTDMEDWGDSDDDDDDDDDEEGEGICHIY